MYYANVVHLVLVGEEEANTGVTKLWLKLLSGVIEKKLLVKPLLSFVVDSVKLDITNVIYFSYIVFFSNVQVPLLINLLKNVNLGVLSYTCASMCE